MNPRIEHLRRREEGAALIIVLAFVVLLTGVAVAYLARTTTDRAVAQSSSNQSKANQLAESGADTVIGDLRQEIVNGSTATTVGSSTIYTPTTAANMLPQRSGTSDLMPNLIRRSVSPDNMILPGVGSRASLLNSGPVDPANPKRGEITLPRWNKHYLIPRPGGANPTDTTPISGAGGFTAPDWVILTRGGPVASTWNITLADQTPANDSYAVGRYAYAVYDEGGLLDANVAGYPATATTAAQYGPKGVSAFADLTVLGMSNGGIDGLVGWRNYASAQPTGSFPNFTFASATNYVNSVLSNNNGFMGVGTITTGGRTDQAFVNRQSLIEFRRSNGFTADALQYLTTFSRELNAPSFTPPTPSAINPNFLQTRAATAFTRFDGSTATIGEPLVKRRFPLSRLAWVTYKGPSALLTIGRDLDPTLNNPATSDPILIQLVANNVTLQTIKLGTAASIQTCFGLVWDGTNNRWNYAGATGSTPLTSIATLAGINHEPNFFELLKAAILNGSVGLGSSGATFVAAETKYYSAPLSSDYQILQIGANIIDQADPDNVPTFINFNNTTLNGSIGDYEVAGIENLPYLNKLVFDPRWNGTQFEAWLLPSLWNPHQNAPPASQNVQIAMPIAGQSMTAVLTYSGTIPLTSTPPVAGGSSGATKQFMTVDAANFNTSPSAPTIAIPDPKSSITKNPANNYYGFHFTFVTPPAATPSNSFSANPNFGAGCNFDLQVLVNGSPKTYQRWKALPATVLKFQPPASSYWTTANLQDPEFVTLDPRTVRFGVWGNAGNLTGAVVPDDFTRGTQLALDDSPPVEAVNALGPSPGTSFFYSFPTNFYLYAYNNDLSVYYNDRDGVKRSGDTVLTVGPVDEVRPANWIERPRILNRPFRSVGELGEVFRDQPWKTLNLATPNTPDVALLDVFTLHEASMEAGKTSLNTRQPLLAFRAILSNATRTLTGANAINLTDRNNIVTALTALQPIFNKTELLTRLAGDISVTGLGNKEARELVIRAFSDACQTRTWNLMIDVIAQSGRYPKTATGLAGFLVEGEQHYWVHVAIDRFTGQVVDKQIEVVNE
jgi:hypothetical protein